MKAGVHAIIHKISEDANRHSQELYSNAKRDADAEADRTTAIYRTEWDKRHEMIKKHHKLVYEQRTERLRGRQNRELLAHQRRLIDEIFDMAVLKLRDITEAQFAELFTTAVRGLQGSYKLYLGALSAGKLDVRKIKEAENENLSIKFSGQLIPRKSGFLMKDDRVEYNCLFEDLMEDKKNDQAAVILKEVFGDLGAKG